jgi:LacI family transcriptional regulator
MQRHQIAAITDISGAYGRRVLSGMGRFASQHGRWSLSMIPTWEPDIQGTLNTVQGVLIQVNSEHVLKAVLKSGLPAVNVGDTFADVPLPTIISDHFAVGQIGAEHLLSRGFKNLGFVEDPGWYATRRREGFTAAAARSHVHISNLQPTMDFPAAGDHLTQWLRDLPKPVGIMACNDIWSRAVARFCRSLDLRVPMDVAVLGVDNDELVCELYDVPLTSVAVSAERIGFVAGALLAEILDGKKAAATPVLIPPAGLVLRQSTDVLAVSDEVVTRAIEYIRENLRQRVTAQNLLRLTGMSRRQLEQRFLAAIGRSPAAEVRRQRVEQAKQLLSSTDAPIATVAGDCGFPDAPRLTKVFGRETGMTPLQYRMRNRLR